MPKPKPDAFKAAMSDQDEWASSGACVGDIPDIFDTVRRKHVTAITDEVEAARDVCTDCPVMLRCLEHAIRFDARHAVWGGMTDEERDRWALAYRPELIPARRLRKIKAAIATAA